MTDPNLSAADRWAAISALLDEALALEADARAAWLSDLETRDPDRAATVRRLLSTQTLAAGTDLLSSGIPPRLLAEALGGAGASLQPGAMIGSYRLVRPIGAGGMATVWLAEQTAAVLRQVALKVPHAGLEASSAAAARFERERDLLASLEHEHIARLYDAGVTPDGVAFLAMELIDGVPITQYCDTHRLSIPARLALFRQVLEAVGLAHRRLVIHRDLKPSNILVTATGQVKLLDFGIANLLSDAPAPGAARGTEALTPDTASPEQLAGTPLGTASDVYSLGVVLYELLAGHKPYTLDRTSPSLHAALMATTVPRLGEAATEQAAAERATSLRQLRRTLGTEIEAIVAHCLAKSPADRYQNVEAIAADLEHLARHEPVSAFEGGAGYRLRCFVRRRRWPLAAGVSLLIVLLGGAAATAWQGREALAQAQRAEAIQKFLLSLFRSNTPAVAEGHETTARDLLARGSERVDAELKTQPRALAELHSELGDIYNEMGDNDAALKHLERAIAGFRALGLADSRDGLDAVFRHGIVLMDKGEYAAARADMMHCLEVGRTRYGPRHRWAVGAREKLAFMFLESGDSDSATAMAQEALAQPVGEDLANDELRRLRVIVILGEAQTNLGDYAAARATLTKAVAMSAGPAGYSIVDRIVYRVLLTRAIMYSGDAVAAEPAAAALVADEERILGERHPLVFPARQLWSHALAGEGRYAEAVEVQRKSVRLAESEPTPSADRIASQRRVLAVQLALAGQYREAEELIRSVIATWSSSSGDAVPRRPLARRVLSLALLGEHRLDDAQSEIELAMQEGRRIPHFTTQPDWPVLLESASDVRRVARDYGGALPPREEACALLDHSPGASMPPALRCNAMLTWLRAAHAPEDVRALAAFDAAAATYAAALPPSHIGRLDLVLLRAELDTLRGRPVRTDLGATRDGWKAALGVQPQSPIVILH